MTAFTGLDLQAESTPGAGDCLPEEEANPERNEADPGVILLVDATEGAVTTDNPNLVKLIVRRPHTGVLVHGVPAGQNGILRAAGYAAGVS